MDFECTLLGSLNFKENRKLGEVMAPDDDGVDRRERGNAYAQPNMTRRGWSEGKRRVHRPYGASLVTRDAPQVQNIAFVLVHEPWKWLNPRVAQV